MTAVNARFINVYQRSSMFIDVMAFIDKYMIDEFKIQRALSELLCARDSKSYPKMEIWKMSVCRLG